MDKNDPLHRMFREAGHEVPARDLTASIMARVEAESLQRVAATRPLIGAKGWISVGLLTVIALVLAGVVPDQAPSVLRAYLPSTGAALEWVRSWSAWAALVPAGILLIGVLERLAARYHAHRTVLH